MEILIGTSGWSYDDWVGNFDPDRLCNAKNEWFGFYAKYLKSVEINSTFYRMPKEFIVNSWINKGKLFDDFEFFVSFLRFTKAFSISLISKNSGLS